MTKTAKPAATDPATARDKVLKRQREIIARKLLKRRRAKSGQ